LVHGAVTFVTSGRAEHHGIYVTAKLRMAAFTRFCSSLVTISRPSLGEGWVPWKPIKVMAIS
jgi:hypothetical protein